MTEDPSAPPAGTRIERIRAALAALDPVELAVIDESERHRGHAGWRESGETHYRVQIRARALSGLGRVACHRRINALLAPEFETGLHALAIEAAGAD
ncbi:MAG: BolA family transcriptional regulator [Hyphomicrobiales bacterium]|uniref:BolA family protein n=1 Tax=Rhabdaerophilum calidifontis TaxID=2604328 RepID=UPI00123A2D8D|nr:BolA family protein [Rhabdaerophilum calidifontis]MCA1951952.1 BolA family transcriptional regulator [Hyphomicrobiales bacterium]MCA1998742.1 BolA family transcriptional regulator [Hyphomicrobiales bacterium]